MSYFPNGKEGSVTMERVIVADNDGEKEVDLMEEKRDDNNALISITVIGRTGGRKFMANNGLSGGEASEDALRRFTVNDLSRGHALDLEGRLVRGEPKTQPKPTDPANLRKGKNKKKKPKQKPPAGDLKTLTSETH